MHGKILACTIKSPDTLNLIVLNNNVRNIHAGKGFDPIQPFHMVRDLLDQGYPPDHVGASRLHYISAVVCFYIDAKAAKRFDCFRGIPANQIDHRWII